MAAAIVLFAVAQFGFSSRHGDEDWRGAMQAVRRVARTPETPVLIASPFPESADLRLLSGQPDPGPLLAPVIRYPATGAVIPLPLRLNLATIPYLQQIVERDLKQARRFLLVAPADASFYESWLLGRLAWRRVEARHLGDFGKVSVVLYTILLPED